MIGRRVLLEIQLYFSMHIVCSITKFYAVYGDHSPREFFFTIEQLRARLIKL